MRFQPWFAWLLAWGVGAVWLAGQISNYLSFVQLFHPESSLAAAATGLIAIAVLAATLVVMMLRRGHPALLLGIQVVALIVPYAVVGQGWAVMGVGAVVCAGILLNVPVRRSRVLFAVVVVGCAAIAGTLHGEVSKVALIASINAANGFLLFSVIRLLHLVLQAHDERGRLVAFEVMAERACAAERVRTTVTVELSATIRRARDALGSPTLHSVDAAAIAGLSRQASAAVRTIASVHRDPLPVAPTSAPDVPAEVTYRFTWWVHLILVINVAVVSLTNLFWDGGRDDLLPIALLIIGVAAAFQLYHGPPRSSGFVPRWWRWTLAAQMILPITVTATLFRDGSLLPPILLAVATAVLRMPARWSWCVPAAAMVIVFGFHTATFDPWFGAHYALGVVYWSVAVYALCNLPTITTELHDTRHELARIAVVTERLRFARDVHDLLGFHLTAITLKAELATQLVDADPDTARKHLNDALHSAELALVELRGVAGLSVNITCDAELAAARTLLELAGIAVTITSVPHQLPPKLDHLLGIVVRETATNVFRHSSAQRCAIAFTGDSGSVQLRVSNDGVPPAPTAPRVGHGGRGLANLAARVNAAGGQLDVTASAATFTVAARVPSRPPIYSTRVAESLAGRS